MKIGIIGAGRIGRAIAKHLARSGHYVIVSNSRGPESLSSLVAELGQTAKAGARVPRRRHEHVAVARVAPAQHPLAIHDERRAVCDIALLVVYAIGADDRPVHVAQQREGEPAGASECVMTERAVAADR